MFQVHYQTQVGRPQTTAHLAQTMALLSLTSEELKQQIEAELASNPALEILAERRCPNCHRLLYENERCPVCSLPQTNSDMEPVVFLSPREDFYSKSSSVSGDMPEDNLSPHIEDLPTYVLRQIAPDLENGDRQIAAYLLTNLDDDGLINIPLAEVARYYHTPIARIHKVVSLIQHADPIGVGSATPQEALLVQLDVLSESHYVPDLAFSIIREAMDLLSRRQYGDMARKFKTPLRRVQKAVSFISENLNPYPARSYWGDSHQAPVKEIQVYHQPDVIINYMNDDPENPLMVEVVLPIGGTLRVNPQFRKAVRLADTEKKELWRSDIDSASLLVKCIQQRNHTMLRLMQRIVTLQRDFILYGNKSLRPMTRAQISDELEVHESTISRAVSSKTVQLPNRKIVPLSIFFERNLHIRTVLRDLIEGEDRVLSDTELVNLLAQQGYSVARRTVAKYRSMEGILPAHLRKNMNKVKQV